MNKKGFTPLDKRNISKRSYLTGFTLLEILVAAVIMAMVMTGLAYVFLAGKRHLLHTRSKIQAAELGRLFLDYLPMHVRQDTWDQPANALFITLPAGRDCASQPDCPPVTERILDGITYNPQYYISNVGTTLRKAKVTITWNEPTP